MRGLPGLRMDAVQVHRDTSTTDAEGNVIATRSLLYDGRGSFTEAADSTYVTADTSAGRPFGTRSGRLELCCATQFVAGDRVTLWGVTWSVVAARHARTHQVLQLVSPDRRPA
jgi:hypothetical protein